jgi:hypothetical protein
LDLEGFVLIEFLTLYEAVMKPVATALDVLQGEEDTFIVIGMPREGKGEIAEKRKAVYGAFS